MKTSLLLIYFAYTFGSVLAIQPRPRFKQGCVALQQKLYCYGGGQYVSGGINYNTVFSDHLVLDLSKDFAVSDAQTAWNNIPAQADFVLEPNYSYGFAVINSTSYVITSGSGYNDGKTILKNKTTIYHADTGQWQTIPSNANNQSIGATLNIDKDGKAYLFGGLVVYTNVVPNRNFLTFEATTGNRWQSSPLGPGTVFRTDHASAMDNNGVIYYTGGRLGTASGTAYTWNTNVPMTTITTYDTKAQTWGSIAAKSSGSIPTLRNSHTFTYLPKTNQFVLFGGKQGNSETPGTFDDICYTFDPTTSMWTQQNVSQIGSGARFGHSAVLYMDSYLFIIFGADHVTMSMNNFFLLNVENWTWLDNFTANGLPSDSSSNGTSSGNQNPSSGIGGGAIAGIVIGVVAVIAIAAVGAFFMRRRNRNKQESTTTALNDQFVIDRESGRPLNDTHFSGTTQAFMNANNNSLTKNNPSPLTQVSSQQQSDRVYHPDEMSTSTAPTYTSTSPLQPKPDLASFDNHGAVKPHGTH